MKNIEEESKSIYFGKKKKEILQYIKINVKEFIYLKKNIIQW
jgi:hypothetical protein